MMLRRFLLSAALFLIPLWAHADWAADRDASAGYVTVTTLATAVDEAVPFCVVYLSDLPADFHTAMSTASDTDGKTIRVSTSDGTTQLACVPIGVNTGTDSGCLIFLGTGMSASTDVDFRIYVGNASLSMPTASGGMGEQAVFASYAGVYFPGMDTRDWTSGGRTLTAVNTPGTAASGYEGITAATYTAGSTQYHHYSSAQAVTDWPLTMEALAYSTSSTTNQRAFQMSCSTSSTSWCGLQFGGAIANDPTRGVVIGQAGSAAIGAINSYATSTWYYLELDRDDNTGTTNVYRDASTASSSTTVNTPTAFDRLVIGSGIDNSGVVEKMTGRVAVALLSSSVRSADYVSTMQDNWAGTMYTAGAWTALGTCNTGSTGWVLFQTIGQSTSAAADWSNTSDALVDDSNTADVTLDDAGVFESEYLNFTNPAYGTTPPAGADSYTVSFRIKKKSDTTSAREIQDLTVQFIDDTGTRVGDNMADAVTDWPSVLGTTDYTMTGYTPDGTEFTSAAGVSIRATGINTNGATLAEIATVWIKVDWDCGDDPTANARGFFALTE